MQLENCESSWAGSSQAVGQSGNAAGVAASPAGDTGLGRDVGLLGQEDPRRALGRLERWAELCYPAPLHSWGEPGMHWELEEQCWEGSGAEESVLLELGLQSKVGGGTGW